MSFSLPLSVFFSLTNYTNTHTHTHTVFPAFLAAPVKPDFSTLLYTHCFLRVSFWLCPHYFSPYVFLREPKDTKYKRRYIFGYISLRHSLKIKSYFYSTPGNCETIVKGSITGRRHFHIAQAVYISRHKSNSAVFAVLVFVFGPDGGLPAPRGAPADL